MFDFFYNVSVAVYRSFRVTVWPGCEDTGFKTLRSCVHASLQEWAYDVNDLGKTFESSSPVLYC